MRIKRIAGGVLFFLPLFASLIFTFGWKEVLLCTAVATGIVLWLGFILWLTN